VEGRHSTPTGYDYLDQGKIIAMICAGQKKSGRRKRDRYPTHAFRHGPDGKLPPLLGGVTAVDG